MLFGTKTIPWINLNEDAQLDAVLDASQKKPVAIFKHSTRCSISAAAKGRLERKWDDFFAENEVDIYYLDLLKHRNISNKVEELFGIEHQSPQLILIKDGKAIYNASHFGISTEKIADVIHQE